MGRGGGKLWGFGIGSLGFFWLGIKSYWGKDFGFFGVYFEFIFFVFRFFLGGFLGIGFVLSL